MRFSLENLNGLVFAKELPEGHLVADLRFIQRALEWRRTGAGYGAILGSFRQLSKI